VLTVGVNLLWCRPGEVGGSEEYLARQLAGLAELDLTELDLTLFVLPAYPSAHRDLAGRFTMVRAPVDASPWSTPGWRRARGSSASNWCTTPAAPCPVAAARPAC
jgi:hypothetical protein